MGTSFLLLTLNLLPSRGAICRWTATTFLYIKIPNKWQKMHKTFTMDKRKLSSLNSKKNVHNYLAFISIEKILSGIDIKGIVTSYIWKIEGVFLFDLKLNDEVFLISLFFIGRMGEILNSKKNINPPFLRGLNMDFRQPLNYSFF